MCLVGAYTTANLQRHHVLVLRLYTSNTYRRLNGPLRDITGANDPPHPFRYIYIYISIYILSLIHI